MAALIVALAPVAPVSSMPTAEAAPGEILRSFEAEVPACSVGVGLAFDGFQLLASCYNTNVVSGVSPVDGSHIRDYPITGLAGIGAMSFDRVGNRLWLCDANTEAIYTADLFSGASQFRFESDGCFDGLAYDATDDTIWAGADVAQSITHYKSDGTVLETISLTGKIGSCGKSGIAAGASELFVANNGCSEIYRMGKDGTGSTKLGGYPARLEDLECDDVNFPGTTVIWSKDAYDPVLNAFDAGAIDCGLNTYRDSDADGIRDTWEALGADVDGDGTIDLDLPALGANPLHKDLFVEIDWLKKPPNKIGPIPIGGGYEHKPSLAAANRVVNAFKNWPVPNPDGTQGINLHLDAGQDSIMNPVTNTKWGNRSRANAITGATPPTEWPNATFWSKLDPLRSANVDTARRGIFHYALYVDSLGCSNGGCTTGISRGIPGHDLLIARGKIKTDLQEAVTLAHELGHNLGLGHGGRERIDDPASRHANNKANYLSVMNYFYSNTGLRTHGGFDGIIAFSPQEHDTLYTTDLDEESGLHPDPFGHLQVTYFCPNGSTKKADTWTAIDWNCGGNIANGSSNPNLQAATQVGADPLKVLGSEDYHHLYFWGTGPTWDARNEAMIDIDQPGTAEPSIEQAVEDGVWWPDLSVSTATNVELVAYPDTDTIDIPLLLENPGGVDFTIRAQLKDANPRFALLGAPDVHMSPNSTQTLHIGFDTDGAEPTQQFRATVEYSHPDLGNLGTIQLTVTIPTADELGPAACEQAREARDAADLPAYQAPALDAFLATCTGSTPPSTTSSTTTAPSATTTSPPPQGSSGGGLPTTGVSVATLIGLSGLLLALGTALLMVARQRRRQS